MTPDRIAQIVLALALAAAGTVGGVSTQDASTCREILQDERTACVGTLEQLAGQYSATLDVVRDICRD